MTATDVGARCTAHAGEAFRPRCGDCDAAAVEYAESLRAPVIPSWPVPLSDAEVES